MSNPEFKGPFPIPEDLGRAIIGKLLQHAENGGCSDPGCKSCNGKKERVRDITDEEVQAHLQATSYAPKVLDRVRLNNWGKGFLHFPGEATTAVVLRVLPQTIYDPQAILSSHGAFGVNCVIGFVVGAGRVMELLYPSAALELAE